MTDDTLYDLAGSSVPGLHLLRAADHDLTGVELDRTLTRFANLATGAKRGMLFVILRDSVDRRAEFANDPQAYRERYDDPSATSETVDAEVLGDLYRLVAGREPCRDCLNGSLLGGLDTIQPVGHRHGHAAALVRDELNKRRLGSAA